MNSLAAKHILLACRPGTADLQAAEAVAALEQVQRDPELQEWWSRQQAFHERTRESFRQVPIPPGLQAQILARTKIIALPWWRKPAVWAAAAIILAAITLALFWNPEPENELPTFRSRMVRNVLRQYSMDIETNNIAPIRAFLARQGAPSDFQMPPGLARRPLLGAGVLSWQDRRVSMVCIDSQTQGTLFLFVADDPELMTATGVKEYVPVSDLMTASWTVGKETYVLAGQGAKEWLEKQLE